MLSSSSELKPDLITFSNVFHTIAQEQQNKIKFNQQQKQKSNTNNSNDNSNSIALLKRVESLLINLILYI